MSRVLTIAGREVSSLFFSPIAYIVLFLFLLWMGIVFLVWIFVPGRPIDIRQLIDFSRFALFFVVPLLTMSVFSDEYRSGRIEMLRTSPLTELDLLLGKFLGMMAFYLVLIATSLVYLALLMVYGRPDFGQVISSYLGMVLMGCMFVAVGLFFSACTKEQIVAALGSMLTLGILTILSMFSPLVPRDVSVFGRNIPVRPWMDYLSVGAHIGDFAKGTVALTNIVYFGGFTLLFLFWTYLLLESRKWR